MPSERLLKRRESCLRSMTAPPPLLFYQTLNFPNGGLVCMTIHQTSSLCASTLIFLLTFGRSTSGQIGWRHSIWRPNPVLTPYSILHYSPAKCLIQIMSWHQMAIGNVQLWLTSWQLCTLDGVLIIAHKIMSRILLTIIFFFFGKNSWNFVGILAT